MPPRSPGTHSGTTTPWLPPAEPDVTGLLESWRCGDRAAGEAIFPILYGELRKIAGGYLKVERRDHTLQPTALVHEAYMRLRDHRSGAWRSRSHFYAIAAKMIRRILVDHARRSRAAKRWGQRERVTLSGIAVAAGTGSPEGLLVLHGALLRLRELDPQQEAVVEYRFFAGLTGAETAQVMGCSPETVKRQWRRAKAWLYRELTRD
ncbi:MAG: sigma-70 family RNA polymerase sigma factor [Acidobacteriota bacterium]